MNDFYKILLSATLLLNFGDNLIGPMWAVFVQEVGGTILVLGYAAAISSFTMGVLTIVVGHVSDKLNKPFLTLVGYGVFTAATLGYLFVSEPWHLYILQVMFGIGGALLSAPLTALFARYINRKKEGLQWALEGGGSRIVVSIAVLLGALIVNSFGFKVLFVTMFVIQLTATLIQLRFYLLSRKEQVA